MPLCLARHGAREDYEWKQQGKNWQEGRDRGWDPPLTSEGVRQGECLGAGLKEHCERLGIPQVSRVLSSPLTRCVQTAAAAARQLGIAEISIEYSLTEGMLEEWYRSWAVPGADSTWGGPPHARCGVPLAPDAKLHANATVPSGSLLNTSAEAEAALRSSGVDSVAVSHSYEPLREASSFEMCWGKFETEELLADRMEAALKGVAARYSEETVLICSHGGPCAHGYRRLLGPRARTDLTAGYTALYIFVRSAEDGRGWEAPVAASQSHLTPETSVSLTGPNAQ